MKRYFLVLIILLILFGFSYSYAEDFCNRINIKTLKIHLPKFPEGVKILSKRPVKGLCEVVINYRGRDIPLYIGKDFVIVGNLFSYKKNITRQIFKKIGEEEQKRRADLFKKYRKEIDKVVVFTYTPGSKSKKILYMFTDPLCPFSHRAEKGIKDIVKKYNTTLKVVFYPVHLPKGKKLAVESICKNMTLDEYIKDEWRKKNPDPYQCTKGIKIVDKSLSLGRKIEINGVPTFILSDGTRVVGVNFANLQHLLEK